VSPGADWPHQVSRVYAPPPPVELKRRALLQRHADLNLGFGL